MSYPLPYGFQPIDPEKYLHDAPMWRDGGSSEHTYSGELLISLTALSPLLVGNHQHKESEKQSVLVPQMLEDGRVLLAATSLKGMLRSALARLLNAPMQHVTEHHYTYRPNMGFGEVLEARAAIVTSIEGQGANTKISVLLLPKDSPVVFVRSDALNLISGARVGERIHKTNAQGLQITGDSPRQRLQKANGVGTNLNHYLFDYLGGIDGEGHFAEAFNAGKVYKKVLIHAQDHEQAQQLDIPAEILNAYCKTQEVLADDRIGHLSPGHPLAAKLDSLASQAIRENAQLKVNQLIYVEYDPRRKTISSMGHHFQYRWAYSSSIHCKNGKLRPELSLHPKETQDTSGAPHQLTGARLLFGYTVDGKKSHEANLASGNYKRMAGRITFNTAVEDLTDKNGKRKTDTERFINAGKSIQLRVLGMPRPSAVEFYLKQPNLPKKLTTYGDIPSDSGGDLAGRKYYRHQADARTNQSLYAPQVKQAATTGKANKTEERGTMVRYLSSPSGRFLTTLRFDHLRHWELGALLIALNPNLLESAPFNLAKHKQGYAHKLGYGKPLGMGSIRLRIDRARWFEGVNGDWQQSTEGDTSWKNLVENCLDAFKAKLETHMPNSAQEHLETWRLPLRWQNKGCSEYPDKDGEIYEFHSDIRKRHAKARRSAKDGEIYEFHSDIRKRHAKARRSAHVVGFQDIQNLLKETP